MLQKFFSDVKKIGQGGFGTVYSGIAKANGKKYAIKMIKYKTSKDIAMIANEVDALKKLKYGEHCNPYISCYYGFFTDDKNKIAYIVMEYIDGTVISKYVSKLNPDERAEFCLFAVDCISRTLKDIHGAGIFYLDLQPYNVLVTGPKSIKLIDFGLSCSYQQDELGRIRCDAVEGVPGLMAPETDIYNVATDKTDVWLLGATIYYCLTGLFVNDFFEDIYESASYVPLRTQQPMLNFIVNKCLELEQQNRISVDEIRSKLEYYNYIN